MATFSKFISTNSININCIYLGLSLFGGALVAKADDSTHNTATFVCQDSRHFSQDNENPPIRATGPTLNPELSNQTTSVRGYSLNISLPQLSLRNAPASLALDANRPGVIRFISGNVKNSTILTINFTSPLVNGAPYFAGHLTKTENSKQTVIFDSSNCNEAALQGSSTVGCLVCSPLM